MGSLTAYGVSATICAGLSLLNRQRFDFALLADRVTSFQEAQEAMSATAGQRPVVQPAQG